MHVHYIQHVPFEGLGCMADQILTRGCRLSRSAMYEDPVFPTPESVDALVVMGGPMSVHDEALYPWIGPEKAFIRTMLHSGKPVLGVCLGAQFMASALGARIYPNPVKEIGWFPVSAVTPGASDFRFGTDDMVFHWHGETFDLPAGARHLAASPACPNQAFQYGSRAIGLQFHLEATPASVAGMVSACADELTDGPWIQTAADMLALTELHAVRANRLMDRLLDYLLQA